VYVGPAPEHLFVAAESKEEAMVMIAKLCMRPNDTSKGRAIKLSHYIDLSKKFFGRLPDDLHLYVRREADIPLTLKSEVLEFLREKGWRETTIPDPTLLPRLIRKR
jgi:acetyl-CoA decarbonylase/synthase complex subunit alpha